MDITLLDLRYEEARQQPPWEEPAQLTRVRREIAQRPALVRAADVALLRSLLARVAAGEAQVIQAGDCAEDPAECTPGHVARKSAVLEMLAGSLKLITGRPVVRIGRMAGQFGKPRSNPTETVDGCELPVFRGHMVNAPEPLPESRRPDPLRLLTGYMAAADIMGHLGWGEQNRRTPGEPVVWTSHEALLLDYEIPMLRRTEDGRLLLASTHLPWIGERTRQADGPHVAMLAEVVNPVACKVGPTTGTDELLALCERLDPMRQPGRLTLIARTGADRAARVLPPLVAAVRAEGHPVVWLTDPMHGNTFSARDGRKRRYTETIRQEIHDFQEAVGAAGGVAGGLHLETTPDDVVECVANAAALERAGEAGPYTSVCDPRLNPAQAMSVVTAWRP
ncbi:MULTISPECIES: 3-deoxy-7-phosphoheptulonate synthase [Streptomyces]|uniref:Phospho-2-dehydro-3-deoxyheptonate aldolase n=2 Tax=Streptomyces TaxID=1883 RepID=A0A4Q9HTA6_STRKA|nr:3-deoxy-7-phosphoheptulonate synthase [Streptomyces kasugaensis]MYU56529.1 phospho-2-dehydro-3-deoxyheptonate aldolase [Streptomyces sp. SID7805]TBO58272.1 phospho-2-dehydro-3-deoxyheptonate aldolase [Streptomyces kasugaensis]WSK11561.1 3-deoxy-7-phosphoheptulonate synthase [Streptomyces celluloflavus]